MRDKPRYRIKPALLVIEGDDFLQIGVSPERGVRVDRPDASISSLVRLLAQGGSVEEILDRVQESSVTANRQALCRAIDELVTGGVLEEIDQKQGESSPLPDLFLQRQSHTLAFLSLLAQPNGPSASLYLRRLREARVTVFGVGGVGCHVAQSLAASGIGHLFLLDGDRVELSNLNRQILYGIGDVGRWKVEAAGERICTLAPDCDVRTLAKRIETPQDLLASIPEGTTFLICSGDEPYGRIYNWINDLACARRIPWIGASFVETLATVGPTVVPGQTACWTCVETAMQNRGENPYRLIEAMESHEARFQTNPSIAPFVAMASSLLAMDALKVILGIAKPETHSRSISFDFGREDWRYVVEFARDPRCSICGPCGTPESITCG